MLRSVEGRREPLFARGDEPLIVRAEVRQRVDPGPEAVGRDVKLGAVEEHEGAIQAERYAVTSR